MSKPLPKISSSQPSLYDLAEGIRKCTACGLCRSRLLAVPGEGSGKIMFIGEAPGTEENRQGLPFVGRSGKFLDEMLKIAGLNRKKDIFLTGGVKCHPPNNRTPTSEELKICKELWLDKQVEVVKPRLIVILGRVALKSLIGQGTIKELHGRMVKKNGQKYFITYHPAAGMRFSQIKNMMKKNFKRLKLIKK